MNKDTLSAFLLALLLSAIWTYFNRYEYIGNNIYLFNTINIFPFAMWTLGFTTLYLLHTHVKALSTITRITIFYLISICLLEAFGYYVLNIRLNSHYPSLFGLGIIHAPVHMKVFYVVAGLVFIVLTKILLKKKA